LGGRELTGNQISGEGVPQKPAPERGQKAGKKRVGQNYGRGGEKNPLGNLPESLK